MEWAWRGSSPGPLLRASRPGSMALIHFVCVCVCQWSFLFVLCELKSAQDVSK